MIVAGETSAETPETARPLFAVPPFEDPDARALRRVGIVDVGSNSVRMVVFDGAARSPAFFFNEKIMCGLGTGLAATGRLNPRGRLRAISALKRFQLLARAMQIGPLIGVATAAVREAEDGAEFCAEVQRATGLELRVIAGGEEARLAAQGVLLGWPDADGLVSDIGGSSMELAEVGAGRVGRCLSSPLGPMRLEGETGRDIKKRIQSEVTKLRGAMTGSYRTLFLVGGSWRAIARLDMARRAYPLTVLHEYEMRPRDVLDTLTWLRRRELAELQAMSGASMDRLRLVPIASLVLRELLRQFRPRRVALSSYGIREGLLYEQMPAPMRQRDPLIEACWHMEMAAARMPGFGQRLYDFLLPIFRRQPPEMRRLIKAACLLHDVTWRAHPDYRAEVCFDNATRANLGGLDHRGRVFLGTALLHRYKNARPGSFDRLMGFLGERELKLAETVGRAMRFGAMLSASSPEYMGRLVYRHKQGELELILDDRSQDLFGEVVMARFEALAKVLGARSRVTLSERPAG